MFSDYVKALLSYKKDDNVMSARTLQVLEKEIREDLIEAFELGEPIICENADLYDSSSSFVDFLFRLLNLTPPKRQANGDVRIDKLLDIEIAINTLKDKSEDLLNRVDQTYKANEFKFLDQNQKLASNLEGLGKIVEEFNSHFETFKELLNRQKMKFDEYQNYMDKLKSNSDSSVVVEECKNNYALSDCEGTIEKLEFNRQDLSLNLTKYEKQLSTLRDDNINLINDIQNCRENINLKQIENTNLTKKLNECKNLVRELEHKNVKLSMLLETENNVYQQLRQCLNDDDESSKSQKMDIDNLKKEIEIQANLTSDREGGKETLEELLNLKQREIDNLKRDLETQTNRTLDCEGEMEKLEELSDLKQREIEQLKYKLEETKNELALNSSNVKTLNDLIELQKISINDLKEEISIQKSSLPKTHEQEIERLKLSIEKCLSSKKQQESEIEQLKNKLKETEDELALNSSNVQTFKELNKFQISKIDNLEMQISNQKNLALKNNNQEIVKQNLLKCETKKAKYKTELTSKEKEIAEQNIQLKELQENLNKSKLENKQLVDQNNDFNLKIIKLENDLRDLQHSIYKEKISYQQDISNYKTQIQDLIYENKISGMIKNTSNDGDLENKFQQENALLVKAIDDIKSEKTTLSRQIDELKVSNKTYQSVVDYLNSLINAIKKHVSNKKFFYGLKHDHISNELKSDKNYVLQESNESPNWLHEWINLDFEVHCLSLEFREMFTRMYPQNYKNLNVVKEKLELLKSNFQIDDFENLDQIIVCQPFKDKLIAIFQEFDPSLSKPTKIKREHRESDNFITVKTEDQNLSGSSGVRNKSDEDFLKEVHDSISKIYKQHKEMFDLLKYMQDFDIENLNQYKENFKIILLNLHSTHDSRYHYEILIGYIEKYLKYVQKYINTDKLFSKCKDILQKYDPSVNLKPGAENLSFIMNQDFGLKNEPESDEEDLFDVSQTIEKELQWLDSVDRALMEIYDINDKVLCFTDAINNSEESIEECKLKLNENFQFDNSFKKIIDVYLKYNSLSEKLSSEIYALKTTFNSQEIKYDTETNEIFLSIPILKYFEEKNKKYNTLSKNINDEVQIIKKDLNIHEIVYNIDTDELNLSIPILNYQNKLKKKLRKATLVNKHVKKRIENEERKRKKLTDYTNRIKTSNKKCAKYNQFKNRLNEILDLKSRISFNRWPEMVSRIILDKISRITALEGNIKGIEEAIEEFKNNPIYQIEYPAEADGGSRRESMFKDINITNFLEEFEKVFLNMINRRVEIENEKKTIITACQTFVSRIFKYQTGLPPLENLDCTICFEPYETDTSYVKLECSDMHNFCYNCLDKLIVSSENPLSCPLCRNFVFPDMKYIIEKNHMGNIKKRRRSNTDELEKQFEEELNDKDKKIKKLQITVERLEEEKLNLMSNDKNETFFPTTSSDVNNKIFEVAYILSLMYGSLYKQFYDNTKSEMSKEINSEALRNILELEKHIDRSKKNALHVFFDFFMRHAKIITGQDLQILRQYEISEYINEITKNLELTI